MSATKFKAIVWKELRANLKWAVGVMLGMAGVLFYKLHLLADPSRGAVPNIDSVINNLEGISAAFAIVTGLLIGAAQALAENRGDKWGFLTHRPISRSALFWGKAAAGILLYTLSTGVPVAAALWRIATPGYLPVPFDWRIALPVMANLLCGLVFYFAGFLTVMRQVRWYGSRAMGVGVAFACLGLQVAIARTFGQAAAICAAALLVSGTAAWSTFVAGGHFETQAGIGRVATGLSIGLGMSLVATIVLFLTMRWVPLTWVPASVAPLQASYLNYVVTSDGMLVRFMRDADRTMQIRDPDGRPLEQYRYGISDKSLTTDVLTANLSTEPQRSPSFQSPTRLYTTLRFANGDHPGWYYIHRLGLIAAYDGESRKHIGWLGPDGFSPGDAKPPRFTGQLLRSGSSGGAQNRLVFKDAVYLLDLDNRRLEKIFQAETAETILDTGLPALNLSVRVNYGQAAEFEVISTTRRLIVQRPDGTKLFEVPQDPNSVLDFSTLRVSRAMRAPEVPTFVWYLGSPGKESRISQFDSAGAVVNTWRIHPTMVGAENSAPLPGIATISAMFPLPVVATSTIAERTRRGESFVPGLARTVGWSAAILSSLVSAAAALLRGRRYAFPYGRLSIWTGIALLLGPLGYLLMLALIEWPALESCPACSKKRVVTREHCEHCSKSFAGPLQDGTEIFEPMPNRYA